jgi:hypothetical protein
MLRDVDSTVKTIAPNPEYILERGECSLAMPSERLSHHRIIEKGSA